MSRWRVIASGVMMTLAGAGVFAQPQPVNVWTVNVEVEKLLNQTVLTATTYAHLSGPGSPMYRLTLQCDGRRPRTTIAALNAQGRDRQLFEWQTRSVPGDLSFGRIEETISWREIHFQIDNERTQMTIFEQTAYSNEGSADMFRATSAIPGDFLGIPRNRLLVSDIAPNERVEFSFATLKPEERAQIQRICYPGLPAGQ